MIFQDPMTSLNPVYPRRAAGGGGPPPPPGAGPEGRQGPDGGPLPPGGHPRPGGPVRGLPPAALRGGCGSGVMIAMAMACEPELLIADEPTTALDATIQAQILRLMGDLRRDHGTAILLITHNMGGGGPAVRLRLRHVRRADRGGRGDLRPLPHPPAPLHRRAAPGHPLPGGGPGAAVHHSRDRAGPGRSPPRLPLLPPV